MKNENFKIGRNFWFFCYSDNLRDLSTLKMSLYGVNNLSVFSTDQGVRFFFLVTLPDDPPSPSSTMDSLFLSKVNKILFIYENIEKLDLKTLPWGLGPIPKKSFLDSSPWGYKLSIEPLTSKICQPPGK
jgi:hypothetical protein